MDHGAKMVAEAAERVAEMAHEHVHELEQENVHQLYGEHMYCPVCGQPANRPIPPGQSVREQALGLARQVRTYAQAPEVVPEPINKNTRSGV